MTLYDSVLLSCLLVIGLSEFYCMIKNIVKPWCLGDLLFSREGLRNCSDCRWKKICGIKIKKEVLRVWGEEPAVWCGDVITNAEDFYLKLCEDIRAGQNKRTFVENLNLDIEELKDCRSKKLMYVGKEQILEIDN